MDLTAPWASYRYAVVDVEGNGHQPPDLVELAVVPIVEGKIGTIRQWLVQPPRPITPIARRFHRISDAMVADAPNAAQIAHQIRGALDGWVLVAHNAHIDLAVLRRELPGYEPGCVVDTLKLTRRLAPGLSSYRLGGLVDSYHLADRGGDVPDGLTPHRAAYDALMCARLLTVLADRASDTSLRDLLGTPSKDIDAPRLF